jgi:hypothetical protein
VSQYGQATYSAEGDHDGASPRRGGPVEVEKSSAPYVEVHVSDATAPDAQQNALFLGGPDAYRR